MRFPKFFGGDPNSAEKQSQGTTERKSVLHLSDVIRILGAQGTTALSSDIIFHKHTRTKRHLQTASRKDFDTQIW